MKYSIDYINTICTDLGGTGGHEYEIDGLNEICTLLSATAGHSYNIDALNAICTALGYTAGHQYNINALNAICTGGGGTGGHDYEIHAWQEIQTGSLLNQYTSAEVDTYIAGLSTPLSEAQVAKLRTFVVALKTGMSITNLSDAFDLMYILGGETSESSLKNLVKNAHHATAVNSPVFVALEGFSGDGTSAYIDTNYNLSSNSVNFTQNSASLGCYVRSNNKLGNVLIGCRNTTQGRLTQLNGSNGTNMQVGINRNVGTTTKTLVNSPGFLLAVRTSETNEQVYHNGSALGTAITVSSVGLPDSKLGIFRYGKEATFDGTSCNEQISFVFTGRNLSTGEITALTNAIETYMDSNGKGVIA